MSRAETSVRAGTVLAIAIFAVSFFVHFAWESLQSFAYDCGRLTLNQVVGFHVIASLGDSSLMLILFAAGWLLHRDPRWIESLHRADVAFIVLFGSLMAVAIEWRALNSGRWSYSRWMPLLPGIGVGLLPVLQLVVLPFPIFWMAARIVRLPRRD